MRTRDFIITAAGVVAVGFAGLMVAGSGGTSVTAAQAAAPACTPTNADKGSVAIKGLQPGTGTTVIPVTSVSFPISTIPTGGGTGGGGAKANVGDVTVSTPLSGDMPLEFRAVVTGMHLQEATVTLTCKGSAVLTYDLTPVTINQLTTTWQGGRPSEQIGFHFQKVCVTQQVGGHICFDSARGMIG